MIFVKFEKVTRRAGLLERRVYFFIHLKKGGFIREAGLIKRAGILERIRYLTFALNLKIGELKKH